MIAFSALGVLDDAADVVQRELRQAGVAVAGEQVLAVLPDRLVHVHARAVVADDRLGHEGRGLAVGVRRRSGSRTSAICSQSARLHQRGELGADLASGRRRRLRGGALRPRCPCCFERSGTSRSACPAASRPAAPGSSRP